MNSRAILVAGAVGVTMAVVWFAASDPEAASKSYAELKALPAVAHDFTTPEGAILMLEDAYRKHDIDAAIAAKDFDFEARLMLGKLKIPDAAGDAELVQKTSETLKLSFRAYTTKEWPDFEGIESFFTERVPYAEHVVVVTEVCRFPDQGYSTQKMLVAETPNGWRVLNPLE